MRRPHLTRRVRAGLNQMLELAEHQVFAASDLNAQIRRDNLFAAMEWTRALLGDRNQDAEQLSDGADR